MNVLLLGGTGAMGIHVAELLSEKGVDVSITSRKPRIDERNNISYIVGDAQNSSFLSNLMDTKWDAIIDFMVYNTETFRERYEILLESTKQYFFLSSSRVYANSEVPIKETTPRLLDVSDDAEYLSLDEYALAKARQEDILINSGYDNWTIIRPYITYAENRLQLGVLEKEEWLYRTMQGRTIVFSESIKDKYTTLTYGYDVAKAIVSLIGKERALREAFHITTEQSIKWSEVLNIYIRELKSLGYNPKVIFQTNKEYNTRESNKRYQIAYDRLYDRKFDNSKIREFYKDDFSDINEGLSKSIRSITSQNKFNLINWASEAERDKVSNERTKLKEIPTVKQKIKYIIYRYMK